MRENLKDQLEPVNTRTCQSCGHRRRNKCMLSGYHCITERRIPSRCGRKFEGWIPREKSKGLKGWLLYLWHGDKII